MITFWNSYRKTKWPPPFDSCGGLRNKITESWDKRISELQQEVKQKDKFKVVQEVKAGCASNDLDFDCVFSGKGVATIDSILSVSDIINGIEMDAQDCLSRLNTLAIP